MRDPRRSRNLSLVLSLIGVALFASVFYMDRFHPPGWVQTVVAIVGLNLVVLSLGSAFYSALATRSHDRLRRGDDFLAGWTVDSACWKAFLELNAHLNATTDNAFNVTARPDPRRNGVDIVVGKSSVLLGDEFHPLEIFGASAVYGPSWREGPPPCLEFIVATGGGDTVSASTLAVRVPGAEAAAELVCEHFRARVRPYKPRNFRRIRNVSLVLAVICAGMFAGAVIIGKSVPQSGMITVMVAAIVGAIGCPGALILAMVSHVMRDKP